jgi:hypothetical protein
MRIDFTRRGRDFVGMGVFDALRLRADAEESRNRSPIAEVAYNANVGVWTYMHLRGDKTIPNFIDSVFSVFTEQAEEISIEELEYAVLARDASESDYAIQMQEARLRLVQKQKERMTRRGAVKGHGEGR